MNPREIHEDLDLSCSASATGDLDGSTVSATGDLDTSAALGDLDTGTTSGSRSWKILKKFRRLQLCNK
ncbi:hypothetical protein TIFTF001_025953 [Ficus carica]|uniref:Uncharacterized protein n=1 Tax=Ficus carica TaxID=3494 RepID=A0AA88DHF5_FICCA|nr:hypothetical protein TIFTF001_025953 [Ficus carica]